MKQASEDTRNRAIAAFKAKVPIMEICKNFGICRTTLFNWRKRDEAGEPQLPKPKGHNPRILTQEDLQKINDMIAEDNSLFAWQIRDKLGIDCDLGVIYRALSELDLTYKKKS